MKIIQRLLLLTQAFGADIKAINTKVDSPPFEIVLKSAAFNVDDGISSGQFVFVDHTSTTSLPVTLKDTFPNSHWCHIRKVNSGNFSLVADTGVTIDKMDGMSLDVDEHLGTIQILKVSSNKFHVYGDLKAL